MSINIFSLTSMQPLVYVALALLVAVAFVLFFWGRGAETIKIILLKPDRPLENWPKWAFGIATGIAMVLWLVVVIANHTTVWQDLVNVAFLVGFSCFFLWLAEVVIALITFVLICIGMGVFMIFQNDVL